MFSDISFICISSMSDDESLTAQWPLTESESSDSWDSDTNSSLENLSGDPTVSYKIKTDTSAIARVTRNQRAKSETNIPLESLQPLKR